MNVPTLLTPTSLNIVRVVTKVHRSGENDLFLHWTGGFALKCTTPIAPKFKTVRVGDVSFINTFLIDLFTVSYSKARHCVQEKEQHHPLRLSSKRNLDSYARMSRIQDCFVFPERIVPLLSVR